MYRSRRSCGYSRDQLLPKPSSAPRNWRDCSAGSAAIAACHARAHTAEATDWSRIAALCGTLARTAPSPVVELGRAVAVSTADGRGAGLQILDRLQDEPALRSYHLPPTVRGDLLAKLGRHAEARVAFELAATLTHNERERALLLGRAASA